MKYRSLFIDAADPAAGLPIDGLASGLNLVLTRDADTALLLRTFIWGVLDGFGGRSPDSVPDDVRGGLLELTRDNGPALTVARYRDARTPGAEIVSVSGDGVKGGEELLAELLQGVDPDLYRDVYALVVSELPSLSYGLPDELPEEPEPSPEEVETAAEEDEEPEPPAVDPAAEWREASRELRQARERKARLEVVAASRDAWNQMVEVQRQMADLPRLQFMPSDAMSRFEKAVDVASELASEIEDGDSDEADRRAEQAAIATPAELLERHTEVNKLLSDRSQYISAIADREKVEAEVAEGQRRLSRDLKRLGDDWNEEKLGELDLSAGAREALEKHEAGMASADQALDIARERAGEAEGAVESATAVLKEAERYLQLVGEPPPSSVKDLENRRSATLRLRSLVVQVAEGLRELTDLHGRMAAARRAGLRVSRYVVFGQAILSAVFTLVGIVVWILGSNAGDNPVVRTGAVIAGTGLIGAIFAVAVLLLQERPSLRLPRWRKTERAVEPRDSYEWLGESARKRADAVELLSAQMAALMRTLGFESEPASEELDVAAAELASEIERRREYERLESALQAARSDHEQSEAHAETARGEAERAEAGSVWAGEQWASWLTGMSLPPELSPGAATELLAEVRKLRDRASQVESSRARAAHLSRTIDDVEERMRGLLEAASLDTFEPGEAARLFPELQDRHERAKEDAEMADRLLKEGEEWTEERAALEVRRRAAEDELKETLAQVGARDGAQFRDLVDGAAKRDELSAELDALRRRAPHLAGHSGREIERDLHEMSYEQVEAERAEVADRISSVERQLAEMDPPPADADTSDEPEEALILEDAEPEPDEEAEDTGAVVREWGILDLTQRLLDDESGRDGTQAEGSALARVGGYLDRLTAGCLTSVSASVSDNGLSEITLEAIDSTGRAIDVTRLGESTVGKLYLALRFAQMERDEAGIEQVPIILDDLVGGFDDGWASAACSAIADLAERRQVFVMTSDRSTVEHFRRSKVSSATSAVIDLVGGEEQAVA